MVTRFCRPLTLTMTNQLLRPVGEILAKAQAQCPIRLSAWVLLLSNARSFWEQAYVSCDDDDYESCLCQVHRALTGEQAKGRDDLSMAVPLSLEGVDSRRPKLAGIGTSVFRRVV